jgi:hypothetical protein
VVQLDRFGRVETRTDGRGAFRLEGLPEGVLPVRAETDDFAPWDGPATAGRTDLRIILRRE